MIFPVGPKKMTFQKTVFFLSLLAHLDLSYAGLLEDDEARKAIIDLRQRVEMVRTDLDQSRALIQDETDTRSKSLLDLQRQVELLKSELSTVRGANERLVRDWSDFQRIDKDRQQLLNDRLSKLEPAKISMDGMDFLVSVEERRDFEAALGVFRKGDFANAQNLFAKFIERYSSSGYVTSALFWLGNAQYATRDYKEAIINFKALVAGNAAHLRAPEAMLSIANCQLELRDSKGARKTFSDLIKAYPQSEAALAGKERLASLK